ncbi:probable DNA metabolism protein [Robiginitalea myxolifaciens]|uniref:Probable DNA metabolism protein n=1 Tax=Robiginitalea myxolifaciens TaxID=400055 RepID=A0A1I6H002_9FLAO|nr:DUF4130 domain-containing protein [Robiginitalea myxolifaciens]SFR47611.1 probable DNA metabolism protein [Robiginitalea myxolifaciens]
MSPASNPAVQPPVRYLFEGGFQSYLATVSDIIGNNSFPFSIEQAPRERQENLFGQDYSEAGERQQAERFWIALSRKGLHIPRLIYFAFLSEQQESAQIIAEYLCLLFGHTEATTRTRKELQLSINRWARAVEEEKLQCENRAVFLRKENRIPICYLKPKYNVLPLLTRHFRNQFGNLNWGVFDQGRAYGIQVREGQLSYWNNSNNILELEVWKNESNQNSGIRKAV